MHDELSRLYATILARRDNPGENSYTGYLFAQGLDKILKKIGEECAETLIAAKNADNRETIGEISDLLFHLHVLMALQGITPEDIAGELAHRAEKAGNLKQFHQTDKNS
ncbi:MAG: phosphoribosyl-ATP diphosphatase [Oscillospiraceae bacterium]|jgi:phosphoribosyl-ATP pyrophosphohydrolase|nr:phosphoribosyl-ATP diphosphatase [Oscillospiraceae bacterium]